MKKIGFLSFGHWTPSPQSQTRSAADALLQSIDLAVAAEELGADGAYFRVHHFARQLGLALPAARRGRRQDQPDRDRHGRHRHALREPALHGRGCRRGRPHRRRPPAARHQPRLARAGDRWLALFRLSPRPKARATPTWRGAMPRSSSKCCAAKALPSPIRGRCFPIRPASCASSRIREGLRERIWWGASHQRHRRLGGQARHEPAELDAEVR